MMSSDLAAVLYSHRRVTLVVNIYTVVNIIVTMVNMYVVIILWKLIKCGYIANCKLCLVKE